jgi:hypothetical protein
MLEFFIENTFAMLSGHVFQKTVGIPMRTNCTPLLPDLVLMLLQEERDLDCMYSNISLEFFKMHI